MSRFLLHLPTTHSLPRALIRNLLLLLLHLLAYLDSRYSKGRLKRAYRTPVTCWRGPFLAYTSPAVAPEMRSVVFEQSLKLVSIQILILISTLHEAILKSCKYF